MLELNRNGARVGKHLSKTCFYLNTGVPLPVRRLCKDFIQGSCNRRDCGFVHELPNNKPSTPARNSKPSTPSRNSKPRRDTRRNDRDRGVIRSIDKCRVMTGLSLSSESKFSLSLRCLLSWLTSGSEFLMEGVMCCISANRAPLRSDIPPISPKLSAILKR